MMNISYKRFFITLANENRLKIIRFLQKQGSKNASDIVEGTKLEQSLVSHNLRRLLECHFVEVEQNGKEHVYSLNKKTIQPLLALMERHVNSYCINCKEDHE